MQAQTPDRSGVQQALRAIELCYHWAGEAGDGDAERERQIREGAERDCASARKLATEMRERFPHDPELAHGVLALDDIRVIVLADSAKASLCADAAPLSARDTAAAGSVLPDHRTMCARPGTLPATP